MDNHDTYEKKVLPLFKPAEAVDFVTNRMRSAKEINDAVAEWLRARSQIEQSYSESLYALARQRTLSASETALGAFGPVWDSVVQSVVKSADSGLEISRRMSAEVATPLSHYPDSSTLWKTVRSDHADMAKVVARIEESSQTLDKHRRKSGSTKTQIAESELESATEKWERESEHLYRSFESADFERWLTLKNALIQLQTAMIDHLQESLSQNEALLNLLFTFEPGQDIQRYADLAAELKADPLQLEMAVSGSPKRRGSAVSRTSSAASVVTSPSSRNKSHLPPVPETSTSPAVAKEKHGKLRSRFGSIMRSGNSDKKKRRSIFGKKSDKEMAESSSISSGSSPTRRQTNDSLYSDDVSIPSPVRSPQRSPERSPDRSPERSTNHFQGLAQHPSLTASEPAAQGSASEPASNDSAAPKSHQPTFPPPQSRGQAGLARTDSSGFQINILDKPISEESTNSNSVFDEVSKAMQSDDSVQRRPTIRNRGRLDNTDAPNSASTSSPAVAPASAPAYGAPLPRTESAPAPPPPHSRGTIGSFNPHPLTTPRPHIPSQSGFSVSEMADAQSVLSIQSGISTLSHSGPNVRHPELHDEGLCSSIVEVISAQYKNGELCSSSSFGEMAFAYNPTGAEPNGVAPNYILKLGNPGCLSKLSSIGPPALDPSDSEIEDSKVGATSFQLKTATLQPRIPAVLLRYSIESPTTPISLKPVWKFQENQASLILDYKLADDFPFQTVSVFDFVVVATIDGAFSTGAQAKPPGSFNREKRRLTWRIDKLTLTSGESHRFLARFATDKLACEPAEGSISARFRIEGLDAKPKVDPIIVPYSGTWVEQKPDDGAYDPFADSADLFKPVPSTKRVLVGKYMASA
ncbi:hypothetical protein CANCADRAFT_30905 [Tortispora caseinolytica NRRL Y-17796]|uniref:MHD domain-containing protein n=1 Tax=Tortispora caseinolytica NRRL Y-17796 TaxID=767744 RepID=A0A1E4TMC5_9ASCO|nr:hypothetical protein CANCADRAFT_30905 [Tortispora caseinolytica NRRL Y-17796]